MTDLLLISHNLCPYVQRAAVSLTEKGVAFERRWIDLSAKPDWFNEMSPLGKVPLLVVKDGQVQNTIFESSVILEFLEDTVGPPLHPDEPILRAQHRSWMEFGSAILNVIGRFYNAKTESELNGEIQKLRSMFERIEQHLETGPWFAGDRFSLVDAVFGPIFRYFEVFDAIRDFGVFDHTPKVGIWRSELLRRPSVTGAIDAGYPERLRTFLINRNSALSKLIEPAKPMPGLVSTA
ncbi:MAG: glutathione S-transferase family protein [Rhizobiales bacterium]|nr:glutathione S-transferase family protein [Hyphomicrobiales bacterium]